MKGEGQFPGAWKGLWERRKANAWQSQDHIASKFDQYTKLQEDLDARSAWTVPDGDRDSDITFVFANMGAVMPLAALVTRLRNEMALTQSDLHPHKRQEIQQSLPVLQRAVPLFWEAGREYVDAALTPGVATRPARLSQQVFVKAA